MRPLLGVAGTWGTAEIELYQRFDQLHQLIYTRGGVRPSNAAVEEVAKLVLIRLWRLRHSGQSSGDERADFAAALAEPALHARDPAGRTHPIWPSDEPFRLPGGSVLAAASELVDEILPADRPIVSDPLGTAFDALLAGRHDHAGGLGSYLTPSGVARMMAEVALDLLAPDVVLTAGRPGFGDPYCGTGRFLVALLEVLREREPRQNPVGAALLAAGPFGADQSTAAVAKARINMLLYGVAQPLVWTVADSVTDSDVDSLTGTVPLLLTNPPFGEGKYDDPAGQAATVAAMPGLAGRRRIDPSLAGLVRALTLLAPGGVLGIVLPDGVVASAAVADLVLGSAGTLAAEVSVAAEVSLPTATFALSGTVARTSALFLRRGAPSRHIALSRVDHVGYRPKSGRAAADPAGNQLPTLSALIRAGLRRAGATDPEPTVAGTGDGVAPLVAVVPAGSLDSLDLDRLDPDALRARDELRRAGGVELRTLVKALPVVRCRQITPPYVSVLHIDDMGTVDWPAARANQPQTPGVRANEGDLIVSLINPAWVRAAVIPPGLGPVQISAEFGVFRAAVDPYAVLGLLYAPTTRAQLRRLGRGTSSSRRRIGAEDVLGLVVPALAPAALARLGREVRTATEQVDAGRERLHRLFTPGG